MTVTDSVSGMFGNEVNVDKAQIDILCGGSQKAVSAPPGLTFVTISMKLKKLWKIEKHQSASFYCNLTIFKDYYKFMVPIYNADQRYLWIESSDG